MYNRLITAQRGAWKKTVYEYERGRSVREYTDDAICERFKGLTKSDFEELMSLPCLFAYEGGNDKARIGWITSIKARSDQVRLEFEIDKDAPPNFRREAEEAHDRTRHHELGAKPHALGGERREPRPGAEDRPHPDR